MSPIDNNSSEFKTTMFSSPKSRRSAIKSIASGMTIAALSGCVNIRKPKRVIRAYNNEPDNMIPGVPNYYATSTEISDSVVGLLVASHEGRPTKIDGNPLCPETNGSSSAFLQAEIQQLYDPDRLKTISSNNQAITKKQLFSQLSSVNLDKSTIIVLPKTHSIINRSILQTLNKSKTFIYFIDPVNKDKQEAAIKRTTGSYGYVDYRYSKCNFILSFSHDFLGVENQSTNIIKEFIENSDHCQKVSFSNSLTVTDSKSDRLIDSTIIEQENAIAYIAKKVAQKVGNQEELERVKALTYDKSLIDTALLNKIVTKLVSNQGKSIVTAGETHSQVTHEMVILINNILNNIGRTIFIRAYQRYSDRFLTKRGFSNSINDIKKKLEAKSIKQIISIDIDLTRFIDNFEEQINGIQLIQLTNYKNKLSRISDIVIPKTHFLEDWGVLLSKEGNLLIQQPLIEPINQTSLSTTDFLLLLNKSKSSSYEFISEFLKKQRISFKRLKEKGITISNKKQRLYLKKFLLKQETRKNTLNLNIVPSYQVYDGRYSNNAWLNETPDPVTKLTWGNALIINSKLAKSNNLVTGNVIELNLGKQTISGPVIILPGQNENTITLSYGHGSIMDGAFSGYGVNSDQLKTHEFYNIVSLRKTKETVTLADTQMNHGLDEETLAASGIKNRIKKILQIKTIEEINEPHHDSHHIHSLFKEQQYTGKYQWGMSIDLNACIGCNACAVSCQAENNIPIVGKEEVIKGREMSWIRIDRYYIENDSNETTINYMPVACVHCENAPCEQVCPVNATVHDDEGLNVMTYNRCIGTRYCANNCPYKVRRFNYFDWHQKNPQSKKKDRIHLFDYFKEPAKETQLQFNPEVTIRMRGVMEKCTYCLQRITNAKIDAKNNQDESIIANLKTACQQACPSKAIDFGDISNANSSISKQRENKRRYDLLQTELNTKPRTIYLAKIKRNLWGSKESSHGYH